MTYGFSDIPLYRTIQALATSLSLSEAEADGGSDDWWITLYNLVDKVWAVCAGVCEYAVGRGRVGHISLDQAEGNRGEDESARLLDDESISGIAGERDSDDMASRGRLMVRQLYHNSHHLHARLKGADIGSGGLTSRQARDLTGQWVVSKDDVQFWTDLARRWDTSDEDGL